MAQTVKSLPAMWETQVRSLGWGDPLKKETAIYTSILAWRIPWTEEPGRLQSMGVGRGHKKLHMTERLHFILATPLPLQSSHLERPERLSPSLKFSVVAVQSLSRVRLFATLWTVAFQAPLSMGLSRQEYWSGLPFPSPGDLPNQGIEPGSPALQADPLSHQGSTYVSLGRHYKHLLYSLVIL